MYTDISGSGSVKLNVHVLINNPCTIYLPSSGAAGYVVLTPPQNYTVFEKNASAVFYCSGNGSVVVWILNGSAYGPVHQQRGITFTLSGAGAVITSTLYILQVTTTQMCSVKWQMALSPMYRPVFHQILLFRVRIR